jgi:vacuolar-type H+-ATPase subunit C/Vma6
LIYDLTEADYLSARYQGFVRERSPESIWRNLLREYRWVYGQMNGNLRKAFSPYFLYTELRTLFICFRHLKDKSSGRTNDLLDTSLLSAEIKNILASSEDVPHALMRIEPFFASLSSRFAGLPGTLESGGLRGVEQKLTNTYLAVMPDARLHPILRTFFVRLIDARNIISMYKFKRLEQQSTPSFIPGGFIAQVRFRDVIAKEIFGICSLIREFFGIKIDAPDPAKVEVALYQGITRFLKKEGREPFGIGPILDYLWKCSLEVMNLSVLLNSRGLEREIVAAELVQ